MDRNFAFGEVEQSPKVLKESRFANVFRKNELEDDKEENSALNKVKLKGVNVRVMKGTNFEDLKKDVSSVEKEWNTIIVKVSNSCWQKAQKTKKNPYKNASDAKKDLKLQLVTYGKNKDGKFFGLEFAIGHPFTDKKTIRIIVDVDKSHKAQEPGNVTMEAFTKVIDMELQQAMYESVISQGVIVVTEDGNGKLVNIKNAIVGALQAILKFLAKIFAGPIKKIQELWAWIKKKYSNTIGVKFKEMAAAAKQKKPFSFTKPKAEHEAALLEAEGVDESIENFLKKADKSYVFDKFFNTIMNNSNKIEAYITSHAYETFSNSEIFVCKNSYAPENFNLATVLKYDDDNEPRYSSPSITDTPFPDYKTNNESYIQYLSTIDESYYDKADKSITTTIDILENLEQKAKKDLDKAKGKNTISPEDLKDFNIFSSKITAVSNSDIKKYSNTIKLLVRAITLLIQHQDELTYAVKKLNDEKIRLMTEYARVSGMSESTEESATDPSVSEIFMEAAAKADVMTTFKEQLKNAPDNKKEKVVVNAFYALIGDEFGDKMFASGTKYTPRFKSLAPYINKYVSETNKGKIKNEIAKSAKSDKAPQMKNKLVMTKGMRNMHDRMQTPEFAKYYKALISDMRALSAAIK